jgi:hypothetical protein
MPLDGTICYSVAGTVCTIANDTGVLTTCTCQTQGPVNRWMCS